MKFFKKPVVAVLLTIIVVIASTLLSIGIKFGNKAQGVIDGFYDGVYANGYTQNSIASHLRNINSYADGLAAIANNYDIDTSSIKDSSEDLKLALSYSYGDASYIYYCYSSLMTDVIEIQDALGRVELNERDTSGVEQYSANISGARSSIETAGYNETVREFTREYGSFPGTSLALLAGVDFPTLFS